VRWAAIQELHPAERRIRLFRLAWVVTSLVGLTALVAAAGIVIQA